MKNDRANKVFTGEESYSPKQWREELSHAVGCQEHYDFYKMILYISVCQIDLPKIKAEALKVYPEFAQHKKSLTDLIKGIRQDFSEFEELLIALLMRKCDDFKARGLSDKAAQKLAGQWLRDEIL